MIKFHININCSLYHWLLYAPFWAHLPALWSNSYYLQLKFYYLSPTSGCRSSQSSLPISYSGSEGAYSLRILCLETCYSLISTTSYLNYFEYSYPALSLFDQMAWFSWTNRWLPNFYLTFSSFIFYYNWSILSFLYWPDWLSNLNAE